MRVVVFPANSGWPSANAPTGCATHGGIVLQIGYLADLFETTRVVLPRAPQARPSGEMPFEGRNLSVVLLSTLPDPSLRRWLFLPVWLLMNGVRLIREIVAADALVIHVPGAISTVALVCALIARKPLFVRHIITWSKPGTLVDRFEKWLLEMYAGGTRVVLATGEGDAPPSARNRHIRWTFATTMSEDEMAGSAPRDLPRADELRLIIVARQEIAKGTDVLLQSMAKLGDEWPRLALDVVGDGAALQGFRALAVDLGVADRVTFHGQVTHGEVLRLLRNAHLFCLPTVHSEAFCKAVVEALACGVPVVTTPISVFPHLIGSRCGVVLEERTPTHLAAAIRHCLTEPARYRQMSIDAIATARLYSLERWREKIRELLEPAWGLNPRQKSPTEPASGLR